MLVPKTVKNWFIYLPNELSYRRYQSGYMPYSTIYQVLQ